MSTEQDIRDAFKANNAPVFEPLINFQLTYGGYIFYAGLEPIRFSLLHGEGGYPVPTATSIIEFEQSATGSPEYYFSCAATDYQIQCFLDEHGTYYEDYKPKASNFDKLVEHLALWKEISLKNGYEEIYRDSKLSTKNIDKLLDVKIIHDASDQYTQWFSNDYIYLSQCAGLTTLIVSEYYPEKTRITFLK
jgi:hypothetical protein